MIPAPPKPVLGEPGMTLEGKVVWYQATTSAYGRDVLNIRVQTFDNRVIEYECPKRLWYLIHEAVGSTEQPVIRITRLQDGPAVGNGKPMRNWSVELIDAQPPRPEFVPPPPAPDTAIRQTAGHTQQVPAW